MMQLILNLLEWIAALAMATLGVSYDVEIPCDTPAELIPVQYAIYLDEEPATPPHGCGSNYIEVDAEEPVFLI